MRRGWRKTWCHVIVSIVGKYLFFVFCNPFSSFRAKAMTSCHLGKHFLLFVHENKNSNYSVRCSMPMITIPLAQKWKHFHRPALPLERLMLCDGAFSGWLMKRMGRTRDGEIERASRGGADRDRLFQRFFKTTRGDRWWHCVSFIIGDPCSINAGERRTQSKAQGYGTKYHPDIAHTHNFTLPVTL